MKICLVTAFPPSRRGLNEYGFHIARELSRDPLLSLTILADEIEDGAPELDGFEVVRCWRFDSLRNPMKLWRAIHDIKPDVVWFNLLFSTFGNNPVAAFSGLTVPVLSRITGRYTHVTLHHLMDNIDLKDAGVRFPHLYRAAGYTATRMLLMANSISVLLPAYRRTLIDKYRGENVHFRAHGILSARPEPPDFSQRGKPEHRILAFGKWGTYKRLDLLIQAFHELADRMPNVKLIVAGSNHPMTPGYVESAAEQLKDDPRIEFTGYVAEEDIPKLFRSSSFLVLPYSSATGEWCSPPCAARRPNSFSRNTGLSLEMAWDEGIAIEFYKPAMPTTLARMQALLEDEQKMREMSEQNFSAALRMTMPQIIRQYLRSFDLHQRARALEPISRFRRLPSWIPSRSAIFRAAAPRWQPWI